MFSRSLSASPAFIAHHDAQRGTRRGRDRLAAAPWCRCRCARAGSASSISRASPATNAPKLPNALPSVPTSTGTSSASRPEMLDAAAAAARRARRGHAHHRPAARRRCARAERASAGIGARSPSMLNTPSVTSSARALAGGAVRNSQRAPAPRSHHRARSAAVPRVRVARAIDQRCVVEPILRAPDRRARPAR